MDSNGKAATPKKDSGVAPGSSATPKAGQASTTDGQSMASFVMKSTLSPEAPVFVPRHFKVPVPEPYPQSPASQDSTQYAIVELMSFIEDVTLCPAEFDSKIEDLTKALGSVTDASGLVQVVDTIFQQGVKEPNFRYSGARLCNHLGSNLSVRGLEDSEFTNMLLDRCHAECLKRNDLATGDVGDVYLRGLLLFIAELFSQMVFLRDDYSYKAKHIAGCIPNMMHTLLQSLSKDNIKCTIQVLKLTGSSLEDFDNLESSGADGCILDSVFDKLREIVQKPDIDPTASLMIKNVLELREKNWGRSSSSSSSPSGCASDDNLPITCGPDGVPLSREEENFVQDLLLEEQMSGLEVSDGGSGYANDCCNDEMDDEVAAAYEEFLRDSGR
ncbi:poly(A) binding protein interacting protein 1 isoform X1 [Dermacentor variabilis]|uniref:poly(A) binding protein interacting protein 1 isoform X1 n=2 Tax=Dermacentor variabilis TaxID=34621 RepID=UPI003F5B30AD